MAIAPPMTVLVLCVIGGIQPSLAQSQSIMDGPYGKSQKFMMSREFIALHHSPLYQSL
jgi:hypothetical protein